MLKTRVFVCFVLEAIYLIGFISGEAVQSNLYSRKNFGTEKVQQPFYSSDYKRFRRGYGGNEEQDFGNFQSYEGSKSNVKSFGTFRNKKIQKGGSRHFDVRKTPGLSGGPDSFLTPDRSDGGSSSSFMFPGRNPFTRPQPKWSNTFPQGKETGGSMSFPGSKKSSKGFRGYDKNINSFPLESQKPAFSSRGNMNFNSGAMRPHSEKFFPDPRFSDKIRKTPYTSSKSMRPTGTMESNIQFPPGLEKQIGLQNFLESSETNRGEDEMVIGKADFGERVVDPNLLGPYRELDLDSLNALLKGLGAPSTTTTTKRPNRIILDKDRHKIFSGGSSESSKDKDVLKASMGLPKMLGNYKMSQGEETSSDPESCGDPPTPINGRVRCTTYSGCRVDCMPNYQMPNGDTNVYLTCKDSQWIVNGAGTSEIPACEPVCNPPCMNDGICLLPNVCDCPDDWEGATCEIHKEKQERCFERPPTPMNSRIFCNQEECVARCVEGYEFSEGYSRMTFKCTNGKWALKSKFFDAPQDCKPICYPACENGGVCLAPDVCECSSDFRGPSCQYPVSNCDPTKIGFNGGHNCTGEGMNFVCQFFCSMGANFTFPAAEFYKCDYKTSQWSPSPIPECDYGRMTSKGTRKTMKNYGTVTIPQSGICTSWSGTHYKTFDGQMYSFESNCPHTIFQDVYLGTSTINLVPEENCDAKPDCKMSIHIFTEGDQYILEASDSLHPLLMYEGTSLAIPGQINGLVFEKVAHFVVVKLPAIGLTIKWDMKSLLLLEISPLLWGKTGGLCGKFDGNSDNDLTTMDGTVEDNLLFFLNSWKAPKLGDTCIDSPVTDKLPRGDFLAKSSKFCDRILKDKKFASCLKIVDPKPYIKSCIWDYDKCVKTNGNNCGCKSLEAYAKQCSLSKGEIQGGWRSEDFCPLVCPKGYEYNSCMPSMQPRCGQPTEATQPEFCVEGCACPTGTVLLGDKCIEPADCPCTYHNKTYNSWDIIPNDCNSCTCLSGKWVCTEVKCGSRCSSIGDPHYKTFDGRRYDFMGKCSYYLVKGVNFSIEVENVPCSGAISQSMNFPFSIRNALPSCTNSVTLRVGDVVLEMRQKQEIFLNGQEVHDLPTWRGGIFVKRASNIFVLATLPNHVEVWWDGQTRVYVDAPADMRNQISGLCGTFNDNQRDDFITPEGDIEQDPQAFGNKWKTSDKCSDSPLSNNAHPCDRHAQNKAIAEKLCIKLKSEVFSECHGEVDPEPFYKNCLYDLCSCEEDISKCLCPILADYSKECTAKGITVNWRSYVRQCGMHCSGGQKYQQCGNSCTRTCSDITLNTDCKKKCVEGCNCREGFTLDANQKCIPVNECPCIYEGKEYKPDYEMFQKNEEGILQKCQCKNARWKCKDPTDIEINSPEFFNLPQMSCNKIDGERYTDCMPLEEITCLNMHLQRETSPEICKAGCRCESGFTRHPETGKCIPFTECPCHHGGRSYQDGDTIQEDCNTCVCRKGAWSCPDILCPSTCTAWGDSHYKTFDGRMYDFHGICNYILAKGQLSRTDTFEVIIQNVPCGSSGIACAKSVTLKVGPEDNQEVVEFSRMQTPSMKNKTRTIIHEAGVFIFAEVPDMGLALKWDKGTRVYITLDLSWRNRVKGLCGNYNEDEKDDFQTPFGGSGEVSAKLFGDSWRLQDYCPESFILEDTCELHPHRKLWATQQCAILRSKTFTPCHSEVLVEPYVERCLFDTCGCDTGGDCECLCTAIAAYAHECTKQGVHIRWRTPDLCPMQCDETCERYEPCIPACPQLTCDSYDDPKSGICELDPCVEGCAKDPCLPGEVHKSATDPKCVPKEDCDKKCLMIDGVQYLEGETVSEDDCHTCYCSHKKKICKGEPCVTEIKAPPTVSMTVEVPRPTLLPVPPTSKDCRNGWSQWINSDMPVTYKKNSDVEPIPIYITETSDEAGFCRKDMMVDIKCRSVGHQKSPPSWVQCNMQDGLSCLGEKSGKSSKQCKDYEISVLCDCSGNSPLTTPAPGSSTTVRPLVFPEKASGVPGYPETCEEEGWTNWMNTQKPTEFGEFETVDLVREKYEFCPDMYISDVECRSTSRKNNAWTTCDRKGAICNSNGGSKVCNDYEIRVNCQCFCNGRLGLDQADKFPSDKFTASSFPAPNMSPDQARLSADFAWIPDHSGEDDITKQWIQIDLGDLHKISGIVTSGLPKLGAFVTSFAVQYSKSGLFWEDVKEEDKPYTKIFTGNSEERPQVTSYLPSIIETQFVRIIPMTYELEVALKFDLLGCEVEPVGVTTEPPVTEVQMKPKICTTGWTPWMNSDHPTPGQWDDMENYRSLRQSNSFCAENMIEHVECRSVRSHYDPSTQINVVCNKNFGLQCVDDLQIDHCYDYEIRFYCNCSEPTTETTLRPSSTKTSETPPDVEMMCLPERPHFKHATDCNKFFKCRPTVFGTTELVEESCGPGTLFNPENGICDFDFIVNKIRPECLESPVETTTKSDPEETCTEDYWTPWFNLTHPESDGGDYENYEDIVKQGNSLCSRENIEDVQCSYQTTKVEKKFSAKGRKGSRGMRYTGNAEPQTIILSDSQSSPDYGVECSVEKGLRCENYDQPKWKKALCQDYAIRFKCSCEKSKTTKPSRPVTDPSYGFTDVRTATPRTTDIMFNDYWCPPGRSYKENAIQCSMVCLYYKKLLVKHGKCLDDDEMAPACVDEKSGSACPSSFFLQSNSTCVSIHNCNCILQNGLAVPPGKSMLVSDCKVCQCEDNQLVCDESQCYGDSDKIECDDWTPWLSVSLPSLKGEQETITKLQEAYPSLCSDPIAFECRNKETGMTTDLPGSQAVQCDASTGLICNNWENLEPCADYEVRMVCPCTTDVEDRTMKPVKTTTVAAPMCSEPFWTEWINMTHPKRNDGDYELIDEVYARGLPICPKEYIEEIECYFSKTIKSRKRFGKSSKARKSSKGGASSIFSTKWLPYTESSDVNVICDKTLGLICSNEDQGFFKSCQDYSIRIKCACEPQGISSTTTTTPPSPLTTEQLKPIIPTGCDYGLVLTPCSTDCYDMCHSYKKLAEQEGRCLNENDCVPTCLPRGQENACDGKLLDEDGNCLRQGDCSCLTDSGIMITPGREVKISDCTFCSCIQNELVCRIEKNCINGTDKSTTPTGTYIDQDTKTTKPPHSQVTFRCNDWTPWVNRKRSRTGDIQRVDTMRALYPELCDKPMNISCREVSTKMDFAELGQKMTCNTEEGLICLNEDNSRPCFDYEVSFFCECDPSSTTILPETTKPVTGVTTELSPCDSWSPWVNDKHPWEGYGDHEQKTLRELRTEFGFCLEGDLVDIECKEAKSDRSISINKNVRCELKSGLKCLNSDQIIDQCEDFKIRYKCACESTTTRPILRLTTTPTPFSVCKKSDYMDLLDEVKDEDFTATSSRGSPFAPSSARLNDPKAPPGVAWVPFESNTDQYLQVNLGEIQKIYGLYVSGSPDLEGRVTTYSVEASNDQVKWIQISPNHVFRGPISNTESRLELFESPVEAKFFKILPKTWVKFIALRFELVGCSKPSYESLPTTTKPDICMDEMGFENYMLRDSQIEVSSVLDNQPGFYGKQNLRLNTPSRAGISAGAWVAEPSTKEFVRIDFTTDVKLSGIRTQGRDQSDSWIETFNVRYSPDGKAWSYIRDEDTGDIKTFLANYDANTVVENMFDRLLETRYLEILPKTWPKDIALRLEIIGCYKPYLEVTTKPTLTTPPIIPPSYCDNCPQLPNEYVKKCLPCPNRKLFDGKDCVDPILCPCYHNGNRYALGSLYENTECEECQCSLNGESKCQMKDCPPCKNPDERGVKTPFCKCICKPCPVGTKLCPTDQLCIDEQKWCDGVTNCHDDEKNCTKTIHRNVDEKCPEPVCPPGAKLTIKEPTRKGRCQEFECESIPTGSESCVKPYCPLDYEIVMEPRVNGEACPRYTCVPEPSTTVSHCPTPECPIGYDVLSEDDPSEPAYDEYGCKQYSCVTLAPPTIPCPPANCPLGYEVVHNNPMELSSLCPEFECVPITTTTLCPKRSCPSGLQAMSTGTVDGCPQYTCIMVTTAMPPDLFLTSIEPCKDDGYQYWLPFCDVGEEIYQKNPNERCPIFGCKRIGSVITTTEPTIVKRSVKCNVLGEGINTFDGDELNHPICHHILARDRTNNDWEISLHSQCSEASKCTLSIKIVNTQVIEIFSDRSLVIDGNKYTTVQAQKIGSSSNTFTLSSLGETLVFVSKPHQFTILWNADNEIIIEIPDKMMYEVDGLCGFYTGSPVDDRMMPDGALTSSVKEFFDSWSLETAECEVNKNKCSVEDNSKALKFCNTVESAPFAGCHEVVPPSSFLWNCLDRICPCLSEGKSDEKCLCNVLSSYVTSCLEKNSSAPIASWRKEAKCYKECGKGEEYYDCYPYACESSCESESDSCSTKPTAACMPGCFCEPGLIRKEGKCVLPEECRDCVCEGYGGSHYQSFDRRNFTFHGDCSYIAVRDQTTTGRHLFQVLLNNEPCEKDSDRVCSSQLTVKYANQEVTILVDEKKSMVVKLNGTPLKNYPFSIDWLYVEQPHGSQVSLLMKSVQLEVTYQKDINGFVIKVPSHLYEGKLEGLCGNCNGDQNDDFTTKRGEDAQSAQQFGSTWWADGEPASCEILNQQEKDCIPLDPAIDPCLIILDKDLFGKCHLLEDPGSYLKACQEDYCGELKPTSVSCETLNAYAKKCSELGICLDWRSEELCPKTCPQGFDYVPCEAECPKTCANIHNNDSSTCLAPTADGCFCTNGKILENGTCIDPKNCKTCDEEGHRLGDKWQKDDCTNCTCGSFGLPICTTKTCPPEPICTEGYQQTEIPGEIDDCCGPTKICKIQPKEDCPPIEDKQQDCGFGKKQKKVESPGECPELACVCLEPENCPKLPTPNEDELKPGEQWIIDTKGCCPKYTKECSGECPSSDCSLYMIATEAPKTGSECCPTITCELPKDACIFEKPQRGKSSRKTKGRPKKTSKALYKVGEKWSEGLCIHCECELNEEDKPAISCVHTSCPYIEEHPDRNDFVLREISSKKACCPDIKREACIDSSEVIEVNSTYYDPINACRSVECKIGKNGNIEKTEQIFSCQEDCPLGWKYEPSPLYPQVCCGECQQVACEHDGMLKDVGEKWTSPDFCTEYECKSNKGKISTLSAKKQCTEPTESDREKYFYGELKEAGECCTKFFKKSCRLEDQTIVPGTEIADPQDSCIVYSCEQKDSQIIRKEKEKACNMDCQLGQSYIQPSATSTDCCGKCVQTHCVENDIIHSVGATWANPEDLCYQYSCDIRDGIITTVAVKKQCPYFDPSCPPEEISQDENGCCQICNIVREVKEECKPDVIEPKDTLGMFVLEAKAVGRCTNYQEVEGFRRCKGQCDSKTVFVSKATSADHVSKCDCCRPSKFSQIKVPLQCEEGYTFDRIFVNIEACQCQPCQEGRPSYLNDQPIVDETQFHVPILDDHKYDE